MLNVDRIKIQNVESKESLELFFSQKGWRIFKERGSVLIAGRQVRILSNRRKYAGDKDSMRELVVEQTVNGDELRFVHIMDEQDKLILRLNISSSVDVESIKEFLSRNRFVE